MNQIYALLPAHSYTVSIVFLKFTAITHAEVVLGFAFLSFFNINLQDNTKLTSSKGSSE
jgi:hypothetical protein